MAAFAILLSGPVRPTARLIAALAGRRVVAADGGIVHATALGLSPELWVGDFDSATRDDLSDFAAIERHRLPRDKDVTDGEAAVAAARERGARDLLLVGALRGPRSDHAFSNLVLAQRLAEEGLQVALFDGCESAHPLGSASLTVDLPAGTDFSILKFGDVRGLSVSGARYPLDAVDLPFGSILTQSNHALGPVTASVADGRAVLLATFHEIATPVR